MRSAGTAPVQILLPFAGHLLVVMHNKGALISFIFKLVVRSEILSEPKDLINFSYQQQSNVKKKKKKVKNPKHHLKQSLSHYLSPSWRRSISNLHIFYQYLM